MYIQQHSRSCEKFTNQSKFHKRDQILVDQEKPKKITNFCEPE